ncbi:MAG TPA: hypothetical protein VME41_03145 [Stellaceae bacterium]|nr:hypothetical protein [Stellaceae bacterium]
MPPAPVTVTFEPHVAAAIVCLAAAIVAVLLAFALGLAEEEGRKWKK